MCSSKKNVNVYQCKSCGRLFAVRTNEPSFNRSSTKNNYCKHCQKEYRNRQERERKERESRAWEMKKTEDRKLFEKELFNWDVKKAEEIATSKESTLYIIGNGFDLMHGVPSSYRDFDKTIGKDSTLRFYLENYLDADDIWADFEEALGHLNVSMMMNTDIIDMWLDNFDAYNPDAQAADFFAAIDTATEPATYIENELPKRFRKWVDTLKCETDLRPLQCLIKPGKVLCFNYTEFIERLYGVPADNICYIHGCRSARPKQKLILGHRPGTENEEWDKVEIKTPRYKSTRKRYLFESAVDTAARNISWYNEDMTKDCSVIIKSHQQFFDELNAIREIVVVGHSMSPVDWDYFDMVASSVTGFDKVKWFFGCHGLNDLNNVSALVDCLGISKDNIKLFRTDVIPAVPRKEVAKKTVTQRTVPRKTIAESKDGKWKATKEGGILAISNQNKSGNQYEIELSGDMSNALFDDTCTKLFVIISGAFPGVVLFSLQDGKWSIVDELEGIPNQGLLNKRLNKVLLSDNSITFVYRSRVRRYTLEDGHMYCNEAVRNAPEHDYSQEGKDVSSYFLYPISPSIHSPELIQDSEIERNRK